MTPDGKLERPNDLWDDQPNWRGPRGTAIDSWAREVKAIKEAIEQREAQRRAKDKKYRTPALVHWRLDCLHDLLVCLEGQPRL